jgi:ATP-binding protein involved in chromosome partitioning
VVTLEDPVEIQLPGITQVQTNERAGLTFGRGLRSILRQDPDVVLVGEVRDNDTAELALQASLTGHLVLTTLHTNDSISALTRLVDMGVEPLLVASSLTLVVAQRLVRRPCRDCVAPYMPSERVLASLGLRERDLAGSTPMRGRGCPACGNTGYRGRTGIFELLPVTSRLRAVLLRTPTEAAVGAAARAAGMTTLRASGLARARRGETTFEEVLRVTQVDVSDGHRCTSCDRVLADDMVACPWCTTVVGRGHCASCARPLEPDWKICPWCRAQAPGSTEQDDLEATDTSVMKATDEGGRASREASGETTRERKPERRRAPPEALTQPPQRSMATAYDRGVFRSDKHEPETVSGPTEDAVMAALATVQDPDIHRPITELGMVKSVQVAADGVVDVAVLLTVPGCPLKDRIRNDVTNAVAKVAGVTGVRVELGFMSDEQRAALKEQLRGSSGPEKVIPFAQPESLTRVFAIASGKGGVGKSSVTVNLAVALARRGLSVGLVDADIYGHSVPRMLGIDPATRPTQVAGMIMPAQAHDVRVLSIGMFIEGNTPVAWRGTMLHRALNQFLADVYWGDLDILLVDLPPGTGDIAISLAQFVPTAELVVITTPQLAAAEVAERAGTIALQTKQRVAGVIENMAWLPCPHCDERVDVFGSGGGEAVRQALTRAFGVTVPLLGQVPLDPRIVSGGDSGEPFVLAYSDSPAATELTKIADALAVREDGLVGRPLRLQPV